MLLLSPMPSTPLCWPSARATCATRPYRSDGSRLRQSVITTEQMMRFLSDGLSELFQFELVGVGLRHGQASCWLSLWDHREA